MIPLITTEDLQLVKKLSALKYENRGLAGKVSKEEHAKLLELRRRLIKLSNFFKNKYDEQFGKFRSVTADGNPVGRTGKLKYIWSGIFKGSINKQYAAQVSFVIQPSNNCLDVGIYFGRASATGQKKNQIEKWRNQLRELGIQLATGINDDKALKKRYHELFTLGFRAEIRDMPASPEKWLANAALDPTYSSITVRLYPNYLGYIDPEEIDLYVSLAMPFMGILSKQVSRKSSGKVSVKTSEKKRKVNPLTPEQWSKRAERLTQIGLAGEKFIMNLEKTKLKDSGILTSKYPFHTSLVSDSEGYDILSCSPKGNEIFIEVKTTTMPKGHSWGKAFYLSLGSMNSIRKTRTVINYIESGI